MFCLIYLYFKFAKRWGGGPKVATRVCLYSRGLIVHFPLNQSATVLRGFLSFFVSPNKIVKHWMFRSFLLSPLPHLISAFHQYSLEKKGDKARMEGGGLEERKNACNRKSLLFISVFTGERKIAIG